MKCKVNEAVRMYILCAFMFVAALMDIRTYSVKNSLIILGLLSGLVLSINSFGRVGILFSLKGIILPIVLLFGFFIFRLLGAADIKLFCMIGSFLGADKVLTVIGFSFLTGGIFAIVKLMVCRNKKERKVIRFAVPMFIAVVCVIGGLIE